MPPRELPTVDPLPPAASGSLPWVRSGFSLLRNPTAFLTAQRRRLGDTYLVDAFGYRLFFVFSPDGVRRLYELPEDQASFGLATYTLVFEHKVPLELAIGRRRRPHDLFGSQEVEAYLETLESTVQDQLDELGGSGTFEIFSFMRRLGHRLGLACWAGPDAASPPVLDRLIPSLEALDTSDSFVRPAQAFRTWATRKRREWRALRRIEAELGAIVRTRSEEGPRGDFLDQILEAWSDVEGVERDIGVARDVILIHMGAQSNLPAALAWALVDLLRHPAHLERVRAGDADWLERCANESIRMAQRSLTLRQVVKPLEVDDGKRLYRLAPGVMLATMLSVTNTSAAPGLDRFDPAHYEGRRLAAGVPLPGRELVSTFGHGRHSCPAQRFSISAIRVAVGSLIERFELEPGFREARPRPGQIGGVARADRPCPVRYRRRS